MGQVLYVGAADATVDATTVAVSVLAARRTTLSPIPKEFRQMRGSDTDRRAFAELRPTDRRMPNSDISATCVRVFELNEVWQ
jgi:hypothetical protein